MGAKWTATLVVALAGSISVAGLGAATPRAPAAPKVTGPRSTAQPRPSYRFAARGAVRFLCAFDSRRLHRCAARYSQRLAPGLHTLRVQAVGKGGRKSQVVTVRVLILPPEPTLNVPALPLAATIRVGRGASAPAVGAGSVWVPNEGDGTLSRVSPVSNSVVATIPYVVPRPAGETGDFYDAAAYGHGALWVASDRGNLVARIDPATNQVVATIPVPARPAQVTVTADAVWVCHLATGTVTRLDPVTNSARQLTYPGIQLAGIASAGGAVWLLSWNPQTVVRIDAASGAETGRADVTPAGVPTRSFIAAWWLASGEGAVWSTHPNHEVVSRIDPATLAVSASIRVPVGTVFGVAAGGGSVWAVTDRVLARNDPATNRIVAKAEFPPAEPIGFAGVAVGEGAVWVANYDRAELYRVNP